MEGVDPKHAKELARILRKFARLRLLCFLPVAVGLGLAFLFYRAAALYGVGSVVFVTGIATLLTQSFMARAMDSLRSAMGVPTLTAFHSPNAGYVFISVQGIFVERRFGFVPIRGAKFGYGSRQLVIHIIQDGRSGAQQSDYYPIDVPPGVSGEPFERFCASVNAFPDAVGGPTLGSGYPGPR